MTSFIDWFSWRKRKPATDSDVIEKPPLRPEHPEVFFLFGGNASLGPKLTAQALETAGLRERFEAACVRAERMLGLSPADAWALLARGNPPQMQCAFGLLNYAALARACALYQPTIYMGLSVGNAIACFASLGVPLDDVGALLFLRGHFMQQSAQRIGMCGPPYQNIAGIQIPQGGREAAHALDQYLRERYGELAGIGVYRTGAVMISYIGTLADLDLSSYEKPTPFDEMGYHLPLAMREAAETWRVRLEPYVSLTQPLDRFLSGMYGHCTIIGPSARDRLDAIATEIASPFGWDILSDQIRPGDRVVHIGVRVGSRTRDLLRSITPIPENVPWEVVTVS